MLAHRDARLLLAGQTLSILGDRAMFLALAIWAKELTHSNVAAGMVIFAIVAPYVLAPAGGLVADRLRRRPLMIAVDVAIGLVVLLLLFVRGPADVWLIYAVAALYGVAGLAFDSAQSALLTVMLPAELLGEANGAFQTVSEGVRLLGPLVGAGMFAAFGGGAVAILDAATFGVSALCLAALHLRERPAPPRGHHLLHEMAAGIRHVFGTPGLRQIVVATGGTLLMAGFLETLVFAIVGEGLHRPPSFLGVLLAVQGIGGILGGLTAARAMRRLGDARLVATGIALFGVATATLVVASLPVVAAGMLVVGFGIPWLVVGFSTGIQLRTPAALQGRAASAAEALVSLPQTVSIALGAALVALVPYRTLLWVMTAVIAGWALYLFAARVPAAPAAIAGAVAAEPVAESAPS